MKQLNALNAKSNKHLTNIPCTGTAKKRTTTFRNRDSAFHPLIKSNIPEGHTDVITVLCGHAQR